jgi:glutamyl-tRNA reductase
MRDTISKIACVSTKLGKSGIELMEALTIPESERIEKLAALKSKLGVSELIYLATCNRVEFAVVREKSGDDAAVLRNRILDFFFDDGDSNRPGFEPENFRLYSGRDAARHIFRVAASLDSIVIGEAQILGQVKSAQKFAQDNNLSGLVLERLFSAAYKAAKQVRTETELGQKPVSMASLAALRLDEILAELPNAVIAMIGSGSMTPKMAEIIRKNHDNQLIFVNRTINKIEHFADKYNGLSLSLDDFIDGAAVADIIISSTSSPEPIFNDITLKNIIANKVKLFAFDLAIPRDFTPELNRNGKYEIWDLEKLNTLSQKNRRERFKTADLANRIIEEQLKIYFQKEIAQMISPLFDSAVTESISMAEEGLANLFKGKLSHLSPSDQETILYWSKKVLSRACYLPARNLAEQIVNSDIDQDIRLSIINRNVR